MANRRTTINISGHKDCNFIKNSHYADGMGMQFFRRFSVWTYCKLYQKEYVHLPFQELEHNYDSNPDFEKIVDNFFNLGYNELSLQDVANEKVCEYQCLRDYFDDGKVDLYNEVLDEYKEKYFATEKPQLKYNKSKTNVAVHVRRGDIVDRKHRFRRRGSSNQYYLNLMKQINKDYDNCKFYIFSQNKSHKRGKQDKSIKGNITAFSDFLETDMDVKLILDDCPFSDFHHITMSDVIIMSKSAFSYVPGLLSNARILYNKDFWFKPKSTWEII